MSDGAHQLAFSSGGRKLSKCGVRCDDDWTAFGPSCPACADRGRWPSAEQQKLFNNSRR